MTQNNILINKLFAYSTKKIKSSPPLLYSALNPETYSHFPSAKSNGVRLYTFYNLFYLKRIIESYSIREQKKIKYLFK